MIRIILKYLLLVLLIAFSIDCYSQPNKEKLALENFKAKSYINSIELYEAIADKGYINMDVLRNLADSYYFNGKFEQANRWYNSLFIDQYNDKDLSKLPSEYYYRYAQTLKSVGQYDKANQVMQEFATLNSLDKRSMLFNSNPNYLDELLDGPSEFSLEMLSFNSLESDYGGTILDNKFVFTSARLPPNFTKADIHNWTNESFTSLYYSKMDSGSFSSPEIFANEVASQLNDGSAVFSNDGQMMFFSGNSRSKPIKGKASHSKQSLLKIFSAIRNPDGTWTQVKELDFNTENSNSAHPALTPDNQWLYFTSDREGTLGESDLFRVRILGLGEYGAVENLGSKVNTPARETFPFISKDNKLYFSSNGHLGLGGLDVFVTSINEDNSFGEVKNLGVPINSSYDDFGIYYQSDSGKGFVSSNRLTNNGSDNIYQFKRDKCNRVIEGEIYDVDSQKAIDQAKIEIFDQGYNKLGDGISDATGKYKIEVSNCNVQFRIIVHSENYLSKESLFSFSQEEKSKKLDLQLQNTLIDIEPNDDLFLKLKLSPIYFAFDSSNISRESEIELYKVVETMNQFPNMVITVQSHTDTKGNTDYNLLLSERRAKQTVKWIQSKGIDGNRLKWKGYGESRPINHCTKDVSCTEAEHQQNRRSEFIIQEL